MKKSIVAIFLVLATGASISFAQTKRNTVRQPAKRTIVKKKRVVKVKRSSGRRNKRKVTITKKMENNNQTIMTTESGLTVVVTRRGAGAQIKAGDTVIVNYTGLLTNGAKFDSSLDRGEPFSFPVGAGKVIKGWDEGLQKLRVGDHATLIIPASIAYGARGAGGVIPPDATLVFLIEVVGVK